MAHAIKALLTRHDGNYQRKFGVRYPVTTKDCALAKRLLALYSAEQLAGWDDRFFEMDDAFIKQSGYGFSVFSACLPKVIVAAHRQTARVVVTEEEYAHAQRVQAQKQEEAKTVVQELAAEYYRTHPWVTREK